MQKTTAKISGILSKEKLCQFVIFSLYSSLTLWVILHHEPWRDEAQAWLIARDLPILGIFAQMRYEGTPMLWHLVISPFAKLGFPYISLQIVHWLIANITIWVLLNKSPFSRITKISLAFSYYLFWEYVIVARSYGLTVLLLFLIASIYPKRRNKKYLYAFLILLLGNTNAHTLVMTMSLGCFFCFEIWKSTVKAKELIIVSCIVFIGIFIAALQLIPPPDSPYHAAKEIDFSVIQTAFSNAFLPYHSRRFIIISISIISTGILAGWKKPQQRYIAVSVLLSYLWLIYIFLFKHHGEYRHYGLIFVFFVFHLWISRADLNFSKEKKKHLGYLFQNNFLWSTSISLLVITSFCSGLSAISHHIFDTKYVFSGSRDMSMFLLENNSFSDKTIVAYPSPFAIAILPYLSQVEFWYPDIQDYGTYIIWNNHREKSKNLTFDEILYRTQESDFNLDDVLFLLATPLNEKHLDYYELVYESEGGKWGYGIEEQFYLYRSRSKR